MTEIKTYDNRLGIWGWLAGGRWSAERYVYFIHRITGLGVLLYLILHVVVTSFRAEGIYLWVGDGLFHRPLFKMGEFLVFAAFSFHFCNGIRLILVELGFAIGKPVDPVYPYRTSQHIQRPLLVCVMILAFIIVALGGYSAF